MNLVGIIDAAGLAICVVGIFLLIKKKITGHRLVLISGLLVWTALHSLSNTLEWTSLTSALNPYENYFQILAPVLWGTFLYAYTIESEIDRRKRTEAQLAASQERLNLAVQGAHVGLWDWQVQTGELYFSDEWAAMLGYSPKELGPLSIDTWRDHCHPDDLKQADVVLEKHFSGERDAYECEMRMRHKDGHWIWVLGKGKVFDRDQSGTPLRMAGIHTDITPRKLAEEALRASEDKFSKLFQLSPDAIALARMDEQGLLLDVNEAFLQLCNRDKPDLIGRRIAELSIFQDPEVYKRLQDKLSDDLTLVNHEVVIHCTQDKSHLCSLSSQMLQLEGEPCMLAVFRDISESRQMQQMMVQTEKMISVGGIAAGIAHEINNPLGIILQSAQNLIRRSDPELPSNQKIAESIGLDLELMRRYIKERRLDGFISNIYDAAVRAAEIIRHMLNFSRPSSSQRRLCSLQEIIDSAISLARKDYDLKKQYDFRSIEVDVSVDDPAPTLHCVETEIEQVVLNLLRNAAQAMATAENPIENPQIDIRATSTPDETVQLVVKDNGPGIPKEVLNRVLEPFFTTKPPGEGTGLGLSVSYYIITQGHQGTFTVLSQPGKGTTITIELPQKSTAPADGE